MDPRDFLALAKRLSSSAAPAGCRTAISRAYYAAFHVGAAHLRDLGFSIGKGAAGRGEVQRCLMNSGDPAVASAAQALSHLHTRRIRADYQLDRPEAEQPGNVRTLTDVAGDVIQALDSAFRGPRRAAIEAAIRQWRWANGYP